MGCAAFVLCMCVAVLLGLYLGARRYAAVAAKLFVVLCLARHDRREAELVQALHDAPVWRWPLVVDEIEHRWLHRGR